MIYGILGLPSLNIIASCVCFPLTRTRNLLIRVQNLVTHSYVSQATHVFLEMLPLCFKMFIFVIDSQDRRENKT